MTDGRRERAAELPAAKVLAAQAIYSPFTLASYDWFVLGFSNRFLWRCPTEALQALYDRNVSARHLDVGVGTGYFLDRARFPAAPAITLLDINRHSLDAASRRIARYAPATVQADVLKPLPPMGPFDSLGLCYLIHCLPGAIADKAILFDNLKAALTPGARIFGATIVCGDAPQNAAARVLLRLYNRRGVMANANDTLGDLREALAVRFADVRVQRVGTVALFEARTG
jgi:SAM-dependent methyltransferase